MTEPISATAELVPKGNPFEAFSVGQVFEHHWGRTLWHSDTTLFSTLTLNFNPLYFNLEYAKTAGHRDIPINPLLVFSTVFGLSVEDLSELGGAFLGVDNLEYGATVYPGDTVTARSTVMSLRESGSNPALGIASWHTEGFNQRGDRVIDFRRTNLVKRRAA